MTSLAEALQGRQSAEITAGIHRLPLRTGQPPEQVAGTLPLHAGIFPEQTRSDHPRVVSPHLGADTIVSLRPARPFEPQAPTTSTTTPVDVWAAVRSQVPQAEIEAYADGVAPTRDEQGYTLAWAARQQKLREEGEHFPGNPDLTGVVTTILEARGILPKKSK